MALRELDRRTFLRRAAVATAAIGTMSAGRRAQAEPDATLAPFFHGVASGDPGADRVVLWTRVTPAGVDPAADPHDGTGAPVEVHWVVARDPALADVVAEGDVVSEGTRDHTIHIDASGLDPATTYWYAFAALGSRSLIGRTRTAPAVGQPVERLRFGLTSCSNFADGIFNVYARMAEADLDAVVHVGDYIYEDGAGGDPPDGSELGRVWDPPFEPVTAADYRRRYAQYRLDPDCRRLHQQHPVIAVWDDHEIANNGWRDGSSNHNAGEGDWPARKAAAQQVWAEWLPARLSDPSDPSVIYRHLPYGDLADVVMIDTRYEGRDQQIEALASGEAVSFDAQADDPARGMISDRQRAWLFGVLAASTARWKLVGNQVLVSQFRIAGPPDTVAGPLGPAAVELGLVSSGGVIFGNDQWEGYRAERNRLFAHLRGGGPAGSAIRNVVFLTGDIHSSWANDLWQDPFLDPVNPLLPGPLAVEFVTSSVTSGTLSEAIAGYFGGGEEESATFGSQVLRAGNPGTRYVDLGRHGYVVVDLDAERAQADFWVVDTVAEATPSESYAAGWISPDQVNRLTPAGGPTAPRVAPAPSAPLPAGVPASSSEAAAQPAVPVPAAARVLAAGGGGNTFAVAGAAAAAAALGWIVSRRARWR